LPELMAGPILASHRGTTLSTVVFSDSVRGRSEGLSKA